MCPYTASSCSCCQVQSLSWVPVLASHCCAVSIATLCHVPLSGLLTLLVGFHFCHKGAVCGLPLAAASHRHNCGSTLWFWPREWPNE
ncbi:unnamed protein product [Staurois parvus]|uniref:Secreted protein n=1 Tax=Staurois parvus TaxID=386267 RepID=A0ABN9FJ55_9NEOB|nr:unnamed protein product [Staurois parvus]